MNCELYNYKNFCKYCHSFWQVAVLNFLSWVGIVLKHSVILVKLNKLKVAFSLLVSPVIKDVGLSRILSDVEILVLHLVFSVFVVGVVLVVVVVLLVLLVLRLTADCSLVCRLTRKTVQHDGGVYQHQQSISIYLHLFLSWLEQSQGEQSFRFSL